MGTKRYAPMRRHLSESNLMLKGIPAEYRDCNIEKFVGNEDIKNLVSRFVDNMHDMYEDRVCLAFYGSNGTGKTYLSSIIVKEAYRRRYNSHMLTLAHYMDLKFKPDKSIEEKEELKAIRNSEFLVIDEVGKENFTKTQSNITLLEELMRQAVAEGRVIILCTNLPLDDVSGVQGLYTLYGKSIHSLIEGDFLKVMFSNDDYRKVVFSKKKSLATLGFK